MAAYVLGFSVPFFFNGILHLQIYLGKKIQWIRHENWWRNYGRYGRYPVFRSTYISKFIIATDFQGF